MEDNWQHEYKIIMVGDSGVGKSNMILRYTKNEFSLENMSTLEITWFSIKSLSLYIWDTVGQENNGILPKQYYRDWDGVILVYDITNQDSYDNIQFWLNEIELNAK